ncbi:MAG TPA: SDR family NAD(P)-dependent oxidoreductase [Pyrinomonadaceae bacterium]|nr:SDR family NAD(P)-dependent oxidoreductase [Pyrinomonadaceae bacterium]
MQLLEGKAAVITGSGRGIGRSVAKLFAQHGARVVINDFDPEFAQQVASEISAEGQQAIVCPGSVTANDFPEKMMTTVLSQFGRLDIIVNNAGYTWDAVVHNMTDEAWQSMLEVHLTAPFRIIRAASSYLRETAKQEIARGERIHRKIINVSSVSGLAGSAGQVNYSAAKMGVVGMTKALAREWGRFNINVNAVAYGFIETRLTDVKEKGQRIRVDEREVDIGIPEAAREAFKQMIPLGRPGTPDEAAGPVLFLASPLSDYVSGLVLMVTGGSYM